MELLLARADPATVGERGSGSITPSGVHQGQSIWWGSWAKALESYRTIWLYGRADLRHLLAVGLGVERRLGEQDRVLLGGDTQLVVECVMPDLLHVVPVGRCRARSGT